MPLHCRFALTVALLGTGTPALATGPAPTFLGPTTHYQMRCGSTTLYDADVRMGDPARIPVQVSLTIDGMTLSEIGESGTPNTRQQNPFAGPYRSVMISYVVKGFTADGRAEITVAYTLQTDAAANAPCGFVVATVTAGEPTRLVGSDGKAVSVTVRRHDDEPSTPQPTL